VYDDSPWLLGLGRWTQFFGYHPCLYESTIAAGQELLAPLFSLALVCLIGGIASFWLARFRHHVAWFWRGDTVTDGDYLNQIKTLALSKGIDVELLAICINSAVGKSRDASLLTTMKNGAMSWVRAKRKNWTEAEAVSQTLSACAVAFGYTEFERTVRKNWASWQIWDGLRKASGLASGKLGWGRSLPEA